MSKPLKVGVIGCGRFAQAVHLPNLRGLPGAELVALAEPDPNRRQEASRCVPAATVYAGYRDLLKMRGLEAVIVSVPTGLHGEVAIAAMQLGKHLYLEKPISTSLEEADKVMSVWKQSGVTGMVGFNYRFNALYQAAQVQIQAGTLGALVGARSVFSTPIISTSSGFSSSRACKWSTPTSSRTARSTILRRYTSGLPMGCRSSRISRSVRSTKIGSRYMDKQENSQWIGMDRWM